MSTSCAFIDVELTAQDGRINTEEERYNLRLEGPTQLHGFVDYDGKVPCVEVARVVKCGNGCNVESFKQPLTPGCLPFFLPKGDYEVYVPTAQRAPAGLAAGAYTLQMVAEAVDMDYINIAKTWC